MNKEQVISVIEQALNVANQKGVFNLQDSATVFTALTVLKNNAIFTNELKPELPVQELKPKLESKSKTTKNG